jgi:glycosyltransferase involved in cell wall biosynthesis
MCLLQSSDGELSTTRGPRILMLGVGWFPDTLGGLDRYYRGLFEQLPEASGVVIGPAADGPATLEAVCDQGKPLALRLLAYWRAAQRAGRGAEVLDAHFALYATAPLLLGGLRRLPTVFHFQGPWAEENLAAGDQSRLTFLLRHKLERFSLHRADAHVVLSSAFRRVLIERYRIRPWDVHVWAPGVELDRFHPGDREQARERLGISGSTFVAVCARRLVPRMGIAGLLDAWQRLQERLPTDSVLLLAGDGPLREQILERASEPLLAGRVRVLGRLEDSALIDAYRASDVAVVPTVAVEGFGLVVLEAAACGTPSIVTDVGGLPEVAAPLDPSLVLAAGDTNALTNRLEEAARGSLPARDRVRAYAESFDWPKVAERHRELHRRLVRRERDERTRVVYLDHIARLSGGEIALLRLLPHLRGVNPHVILGEDGPLVSRLQRAGISVEVLPIAPAARELRKDSVGLSASGLRGVPGAAAYTARLAMRLRALRADLVHTNSLKAGIYGSLAARAAGVPVLWHVRDRISDDYLPGMAVRLVQALVGSLPNGVMANSTATLSTLDGSLRRSPHWVVPDTVIAARAPAVPRGEDIVFGMVGRLAPWKGQDLFLRAFAQAFARGGARAVIVGEAMFGEERYERELGLLARSLGIADRVVFRGFREDIWRELAGFDALVHASITPEPFGQVVLEGMAAGLAVIAADEGGPASMIADGQTGRLFRSRDPASLAEAMRSMYEHPEQRELLGEAARQTAVDYHPDVAAAQVERAYARLTGAKRRA